MKKWLACSLFLFAIALQARELYWERMDVIARLDADGRLHVRERQEMVFTGDWNGGERIFNVRMGQKLELEGIWLVSPDGTRTPLVQGDLSQVNQYAWADMKTLRWRSRRPEEPSFENSHLVYDIEYSLSNVLQPVRGAEKRYVLNHDFAFPEREGRISTYTLHIDLDPAWKPDGSWQADYAAPAPLAPGESFVVTKELTYAGAGLPADVRIPPPLSARVVLIALAIGAAVLIGHRVYVTEQPTGRFAPPIPSSEITEEWLSKNVLHMLPEMVGAAWDENTSAPEVASILARLSQEKKLETRVEKSFFSSTLHMKLTTDRNNLHGYERELIDAFFFDGDETDTSKIRSHYRSSGFDPSSKITGIADKLAALPEWTSRAISRLWIRNFLIVLAAIALAAAVVVVSVMRQAMQDAITAGVAVGSGLFLLLFGSLVANSLRGSLTRSVLIGVSVIPAIHLVVILVLIAALKPGLPGMVAALALNVAIFNFIIWNIRTRDGREKIALRKRLAAARQFFMEELRRPQPRLRDDWFPYLIAFGLGTNVDKWFRSFGTNMATHSGTFGSSSDYSSAGSSSSSGPGGSWSGGGTSFGGAGATGAWAVAAGSLAAGVSAPSSSSGGGGGGGGSSSGGGGGGGW